MAKKYYVVTTYSGYENKVKLSLEERIKSEGMEEDFGEILIPTENVAEVVRGQKKISERKFFPGYIFVNMNLNERTWHLVKNTPKVTSFVGHRTPSPVPDDEIQRIREQMKEGAERPKPRVIYEEGVTVRVVDGPFANFTGTIDEVKPDKQKVRVLVSIFGRATPVELDYIQIEKVS